MTALNIAKSNESINMEPNANETFNFPLLPYVCKGRFAEICDPQSLNIFSSINQNIRNLCKRCHIIKEVDIDYEALTCKYVIGCRCKENEFCRGVNSLDISAFKNKLDVLEKVTFKNYGETKTNSKLFQSLPIKFDFTKIIHFTLEAMDQEDLKNFVTPYLKELKFYGGIRSSLCLQDFVEFLLDLSIIDRFNFGINRLASNIPFNFNQILEYTGNLSNDRVFLLTHSPIFFIIFKY